MNAAETPASHEHHQDGIVRGVGGIILELAQDSEARTDEPLARVALLASIGGRDQPVAL
jgi:hypothetical protein